MAMRKMKPPFPYPVAFCWRFGHELSKEKINNMGCIDPEKQNQYQNPNGVCKHLQFYGKEKAKVAN